jgi:hypothetical protein
MQLVQQILFILLTAVAVWLFAKQVKFIRRNINLGRDEELKDNPGARWRNMFLLALGQKRMFDKPLVASLSMSRSSRSFLMASLAHTGYFIPLLVLLTVLSLIFLKYLRSLFCLRVWFSLYAETFTAYAG